MIWLNEILVKVDKVRVMKLPEDGELVSQFSTLCNEDYVHTFGFWQQTWFYLQFLLSDALAHFSRLLPSSPANTSDGNPVENT